MTGRYVYSTRRFVPLKQINKSDAKGGNSGLKSSTDKIIKAEPNSHSATLNSSQQKSTGKFMGGKVFSNRSSLERLEKEAPIGQGIVNVSFAGENFAHAEAKKAD